VIANTGFKCSFYSNTMACGLPTTIIYPPVNFAKFNYTKELVLPVDGGNARKH